MCALQMARRYGAIMMAISVALTLSACATNPSLIKADDSLTETRSGNFDHVFMAPPGDTLPRFSKIYMEAPSVDLSDHWLREFRGDYVERDLERIKRDYSALLEKALRETVTEQTGVTFVDAAGEADVIFRPRLSSLNIYAPDLSATGIKDQYIEEAGSAMLDLVILNANSNTVIAQFVDSRETYPIAIDHLQKANRVENKMQFRRLMERWGRNLTKYLVEEGAIPKKN